MKKTLIILAAAVSALSLYAAPVNCSCDFSQINKKDNLPMGWSKNGNHKTAKFEMTKDTDGKNVLHLTTTKNAYVAMFTWKTTPLKAGDKITVKVVAKGVCKDFRAGFYFYTKDNKNFGGADATFQLNSPNAFKEYTSSFVINDPQKRLGYVRGEISLVVPADLWIKSVTLDATPAAAQAPAKK